MQNIVYRPPGVVGGALPIVGLVGKYAYDQAKERFWRGVASKTKELVDTGLDTAEEFVRAQFNKKRKGKRKERSKGLYGSGSRMASRSKSSSKATKRTRKASKQKKTKKARHAVTKRGSNGGRGGGKTSRRSFRRRKSGGFKRKRRAPPQYKGVIESRDTVTDAQCVYFGHTIARRQVQQGLCCAIVARLAEKSGYPIRQWDDPNELSPLGFAGNNARLYMDLVYYTSVKEGTFSMQRIPILGTATWMDMATALRGAFATVQAIAGSENFRYHMVNLVPQLEDSTVVTYQLPRLGYVQLSSLICSIKMKSKLTYQNQTPAGVSGDPMYETTAIGNNPLTGYSYRNKKWSAGFHRKFKEFNGDDVDEAKFSLLPDPTTGFIQKAGGTDYPSQYFNKPPPPNEFYAKGKKEIISPGVVKEDILHFKAKIGFYQLLQRYPDLWDSISVFPSKVENFGNSSMLALEKVVDTGSEVDISVGYQVEQTYTVSVYEKRNMTRNNVVVN